MSNDRFPMPNEIWKFDLKPPAFAILAYLCCLIRTETSRTMPATDKIVAQLHMRVDMAEEQIDSLVSAGMVSSDLMPQLRSNGAENSFTLPKELFDLNLGHGPIAVYAYLVYCENQDPQHCCPSLSNIAVAVGLAPGNVVKHITKLERRRLIEVERRSFINNRGEQWNHKNRYTILPIQRAVNYANNQLNGKLEVQIDHQARAH